MLLVCRLREESRGRKWQIERAPAPPPFHQIAKVSVIEDGGAEGSYVIAAMSGAADAASLGVLRKAMQAHAHVASGWIICDEPPPKGLSSRGRPAIHVKSFAAYQQIIDVAPYARARLSVDAFYPPEHYVAQRMRYRIGQGEERRTEDAIAELLGWIARPGPLFTLLLGEPGVGKSYALHELARRMLANPRTSQPVLLDLRELDMTERLDVLVVQHLLRARMGGIDLEALRYMMREGRITLLLDGFDELALRVPSARAAAYLGTLFDAGLDRTKIVMACRPEHFHRSERVEQVSGLRIALLEPFSREQVSQLFQRRFDGGDHVAGRLEILSESKDLFGPSANPRMLGYIAELTERDLREARNQTGKITAAKLYERLVGRWLENGDVPVTERSGAPRLGAEECWQAVYGLARELWRRPKPTAHPSELPTTVVDGLHELTAPSGALLVRDGDGNFSFLHHSVLEWLVAREAAREVEGGGSELLGARVLGELMADFFVSYAKRDCATAWARGVIMREADDVLASNAILVLRRLGDGTRGRLQLAGSHLRGQNLSRLDLRDYDLERSDLSRATLIDAKLVSASLRGAKLCAADLSRAALTGADLERADLSFASLLGADLRGARLAGARLRYTKLVGAKLDHTSLEACDLFGAASPLTHAPTPVVSPAASPCNAVAMSPDGVLVASGHGDGTVRLWDRKSGVLRRVLRGHAGHVSSVAFASDVATLASASEDGTVRVWDIGTGTTRRVLQGHTGYIWSVAFDPACAAIASGSEDRTVRLWDVATGATRCVLLEHSAPVRSVAFAPDGATLASASEDRTVIIHELASGRPPRVLEGHVKTVSAVAFTPDGATLASASEDNTVRLWDVAGGETRRVLEGHSGPVASIAFAPDGVGLATASHDRTIRLWDWAAGKSRHVFKGYATSLASVAYSADGRTLAGASADGTVRLWDVRTGRMQRVLSGQAQAGHSLSVAFAPDGATLASSSDDLALRVWDVERGVVRRALVGHAGLVSSVAFAPDGGTLASASEDGTVRVWDVSSGRALRVLEGHRGHVATIAFAPDGAMLASGSYDHTVRIWDVSTGTTRCVLDSHEAPVRGVAFASDITMLASASDDRTVRLHDPASGALRRVLEGHEDAVSAVAFAPDGVTLASASADNLIRLWSTANGRTQKVLEGHTAPVASISFAPHGATLASISEDSTVRLWDVETGRSHQLLDAHVASAYRIAFSPHGSTIAITSADGTLQLWDVESRSCLAVLLQRPRGWAAFTPRGRYKVSGDLHGAFWHVAGLCRFEPGELDPYLDEPLRIPDDEPLIALQRA